MTLKNYLLNTSVHIFTTTTNTSVTTAKTTVTTAQASVTATTHWQTSMTVVTAHIGHHTSGSTAQEAVPTAVILPNTGRGSIRVLVNRRST